MAGNMQNGKNKGVNLLNRTIDDVDLGRKAPQNIEMEKALLGALIVDGENCLSEVEDLITHESFYLPSHQLIYSAIVKISDANASIDLLTISQKLSEMGVLESCGGPQYLMELSNVVVSSANAPFHATIVAQDYIRRGIIRNCSEAIKRAYDNTDDAFDNMDTLEEKNMALIPDAGSGEPVDGIEAHSECLETIARLKELGSKNIITGVDTGYKRLNEMTAGFQPSDLIILAGRPGSGKTAFSLCQLLTLNKNKGNAKKGVFFSLEMPTSQIMMRMISNVTEIDFSRLKNGNVTDDEYRRIASCSDKFSNIIIDDTPTMSITALKRKVKKITKSNEIEFIVIDYLQLLMPPKDAKRGNREQEVSQISRGLKIMAKEMGKPIIALAQLSRSSEQRTDKRPLLSDLRESGSLEQDADLVIFLHRPDYYDKEARDKDGNSLVGSAEIIVAKNRNGSTDTAIVEFRGEIMKFKDYGTEEHSYQPAIVKSITKQEDFDAKFIGEDEDF